MPAAKRALRQLAVLVDSALIVGVLVTGFGGRMFMRLIAATSPDGLHGVRTDADEPIGRVTFIGTFGLIVFGGILGTLALAAVYRLLRRWLPGRGWQAGLIAAVIALALLGEATALLKPDSRDFRILSPLWLAVTMVLALTIAVGASFGVVYERLDRAMPELAKSRAALAYLPLLLVGMAGTPAIVMLVVVIGATFGAPAVNAFAASRNATRGGQILVAAACVVSLGVVGMNVAEILG